MMCEVCELNQAVAKMEIEKPSHKVIFLHVCLRCGLALCEPPYLP